MGCIMNGVCIGAIEGCFGQFNGDAYGHILNHNTHTELWRGLAINIAH